MSKTKYSSSKNKHFNKLFVKLSPAVQKKATDIFNKWKVDPASVGFKRLMSFNPLNIWSVESLNTLDDCLSLSEGIQTHTATAISDGSFKNQMGTSGFVLQGPNRFLSAVGANIVQATPMNKGHTKVNLLASQDLLP